MTNELQLLTTREFNGHSLDCYVEQGNDNNGDFWATREQIGRLLGYANPRKAIKDIHIRNRERLNKFSKTVEMRTLFNGAQNEPPLKNAPMVTVYDFRGLLEICRYSNQPVADKVIDVLWDVADEIRRTGMYMTDGTLDMLKRDPEAFSKLLDEYIQEREKNRQLQEEINREKPFTILGHIVVARPEAIPFKDAADLLSQHGIPTGQNRLYRYCRDKKLLCSRKGRQHNKPTKQAIDKGLFNVQVSGGFNTITLITPEGLKFLSDLLFQENLPIVAMLEQQEHSSSNGKIAFHGSKR